jgi:phenylalanine-4-hydroxylase
LQRLIQGFAMSTSTLERLPAHLLRYVVEQDYAAYDEMEQATWRFVLLQTYNALCRTAHPAYVNGLKETGISVERIPRIGEMDRCLNRFGWGAVGVDGFIPPRAFQEFQANRVLTIACAMRTVDHLAYTPAPDIIHESAGHAPILPDPEYRAFLRAFGELGRKAFSSAGDQGLYEAIRLLSEVKEDPGSDEQTRAEAAAALNAATASLGEPSEAALMSRLHWWTTEYGLVGTPERYKLYGAGLLSSVGESHFCHDPAVRKLPLDEACLEVAYDITRPQPQLFVTPDFAYLQHLLQLVSARLAWGRGGKYALEMACRSAEVATVQLDSGLEILGVPDRSLSEDGCPVFVAWNGPTACAFAGVILPGQGTARHPAGFSMPIGPLRDGTRLSALDPASLLSRAWRIGEPLELVFASGFVLTGGLSGTSHGPDGRLLILTLDGATLRRGEELFFRPEWGPFDLAVGQHVAKAWAGPSDERYWPATRMSSRTVPKRKQYTSGQAELLDLYRQALQAWQGGSRQAEEAVVEFTRIHQRLDLEFPDEWLLRWNLLESLIKAAAGPQLQATLVARLKEIETARFRELPIGMGLRFLGLGS